MRGSPSPPCTDRRLLSGWGRTAPSAATLVAASHPPDLAAALAGAGPRGVIGRGLGRSYGDAAQNAGGEVVVTTRMARIVGIDPGAGRARVEAGVSLDALMRASLPLGWWPAVTPGTRQVTVGGAIAADVHGKNHHRDGSFASHVESVVLHTPALGPLTVGPDQDPEVFWATAGGMGLTGLVAEATLRLVPVETAMMAVDHRRTPDLDATMAEIADSDRSHRYSVAWVDCVAGGRSLGRGVVESAEHARLDELPPRVRRSSRARQLPSPSRLAVPAWAPPAPLTRRSVGAFNELWYRRAPRRTERQLVDVGSFFHPLDAVGEWSRLYGRRGLLQYQLVVPHDAGAVVERAITALRAARCSPFLAVLKRFGAADPGPLSFPIPGWTLAVDMPAAAPGLGSVLDRLDEEVAAAGGRVYLAKDSRLRPDLLEVMYPDLPRWQAVRDRLDPDRRLRSDLARRLPALLGPDRAVAEAGAR